MKRVLWIVAAVACTKEGLTAAQYERKNGELMAEITTLFANAGKDCAKLATGIDGFLAKHQSDMEAIVRFEAANPADHGTYQLKTGGDLERAFGKIAAPAIEACASDPQFQDSWERFTK